jgi:hypothetical protein
MASNELPSDTVPIPALLVERAIALARAEVGLTLVHARGIAVRAVSALLGTIVACAFAQLTLLFLVAWPVLVARASHVNLLVGVLLSALLSVAGAVFAVLMWAGVGRERKAGREMKMDATPQRSPSRSEPAPLAHGTRESARSANLAESVSL